MNVPSLTCREAARLLFGAAETTLSDADRDALQAHILECEDCERVQGQVQLMQKASAAWRAYRQGPDHDADAPAGANPARPV